MIQHGVRSTRLLAIPNIRPATCIPKYQSPHPRHISLNTAINTALRSEKHHPRKFSKPHQPTRHQNERGSGRGRDGEEPKGVNPIARTASDSEFLLGTHSVLAALRLRRRKILGLYYDRKLGASATGLSELGQILSLADKAKIPITQLPRGMLDRCADVEGEGRPHNVSHHSS
jgi:hypothetical protein